MMLKAARWASEKKGKQLKSVDSPGKHSGYKVLAAILGAALVLGVTAYARFVDSEKHLTAELQHFMTLGKTASEAQCLDAILEWLPQCSAMLSLCQDSVTRFMGECLRAQSRNEMCERIEPIRRQTSFGYQDCKSRHLDRIGKKACADGYRSMDKYCEDQHAS